MGVSENIPTDTKDARSTLNGIPSVPISSFKDSAFIRLSKGNAIRIVSDSILSSASINPLNAYESGNNLIIENMVRQGVGVGFLPATRAVTGQNDITFFRTNTRYYVNLGLILKKGAELTEPIRYFAYLAHQADRKKGQYLATGIADFAITATNDLSNTLLGYIPLREAELQLALPYGHPMISRFRKEGVRFSCLAEDIFILPESQTFSRQLSSRIFQQNRFIPRSIREVSEIESAVELMISGNGICFVPKSFDPKGRYVSFSLTPEANYHIVIAYPKSMVFSPAIKDLLMILMKAYDNYVKETAVS